MKTRSILWILCLVVSSESFAQSDLFTISEDNVPLKKIVKIVQDNGKYSFWYQRELLQHANRVTVHVEDRPIREVMNQALKGLYLDYEVIGDSIVVLKRTKTAFQQTSTFISIEGIILNEESLPLEGVSISIQNSPHGTVTDGKGRFSLLNIHPGAQLHISYVGYQTETIPIRNAQPIEVKLRSAVIKNMDETIIIGYGKTTKRYNTGSVYKITANEISKQPVSNPLAAMQGSVPGLLITQTNGLPGTAFKVQLRGQSSIGVTPSKLPPNDPLFIIDGVPFGPNNTSLQIIASGTALGAEGRSLLAVINPLDIESIEILKDADATAIYGSRGANGVVLISLKKGKAGKPTVNANVFSGVSHITRHMDLLNTSQYLQMRREALQNDGLTPNSNNAPDLVVWDTSKYTNFKDMLIGNTATITNVQLSLSGGTNSFSYLIGTGFNHETTVFPGNLADNRASMHMHLKHNSKSSRFSAGLSLLYSNDRNNSLSSDLTNSIFLPPNTPDLYDSAGNLNWQMGGKSFFNPLSVLRQPYESRTGNVLTDLDLGYRINRNLTLKANIGYNYLSGDEIVLLPRSSQNTYTNPGITGSSYLGNTVFESFIAEPQAEYTAYLKHGTLSVLVGSSFQRTTNMTTIVTATGFTNDDMLRNTHEAANLDSIKLNYDYRYAALFARVHYMLHDTYIVNLTARRDGSSRFGPSRQYGNFGAAGVTWIFSNENFMKRHMPFISFGKLRGSYGITGNDRIGDYKFMDRWMFLPNNYLGSPGIVPTQLADDKYRWEESRKLEAAIELGLLNNQVQLTMAYYRNRNGNQLIAYPLPYFTGFAQYEAKNSSAVVQNSGVELMLRTQNKPGKRFEWSNTLTVTIPKNKLLSFADLESSAYAGALVNGQSLSVIQGFTYKGIDATNHLFTFDDADGDGVISYPNDFQILGNLDPKWYAGLQNSLHYKSWQLDILWEIRKQQAFNYLQAIYTQFPPGKYTFNQPENIFGSSYQVFTTGVNAAANHAIDNFLSSNGALSDASYIRVRNIALSWSLPERWLDKLSFKSCRLYMKGQNLFTITRFYGADPETQSIRTLPPLRTITGGIELSF